MLRRGFKITRLVLEIWPLLGILGMATGRVVVTHAGLEWLIFCPVLLWLLSWLVQGTWHLVGQKSKGQPLAGR